MPKTSHAKPFAQLPAGLGQHYEVRGELGRGATGTVYHAWDTFAQRDVALKVAHAQVFNDDPDQTLVRKAWLNEVHLAGSLHHPYIVEVFDAGFGDNSAYLVMEYLPYGTLEPFTKPDNLKPVPEVLDIAYKCASALDYACRAGIVHRDIKPANLQLVGKGEAKVCDFGAAYWSKGNNDATQVMDIGSLAYMAPELFRQWVTPQADIYALGIVLHQLLTSKRPFDAPDQASLMYKILNGERDPLTSFRPDLPENLNALLDKMLARSLEDRFANWPSVLSALSRHSTKTLQTKSAAVERPDEAELYDQLRQLPLLAALNDAHLWELLRISQWRKIKTGAVLMREGDNAVSCYLLLKGEARVLQKGKLIALLHQGTLFGELAFAEETPSPRAATVVTASDATIGKWPYSKLNSASPGLQSKMLQIFFRLAAERLKQSDERCLRLYRQYARTDDSSS
ncbi:serine/threonine protein kinase [Propionivibrio sp.]|uniref:serine/threonine protein kinase n=1 Tax=Propionivibrio sp. TaxID=2212460 RepID=UPI003BF3BB61